MSKVQAGEALVRFRQVQKSYDEASLIVNRLDLDVYKGEFLTLLGPSGSGKTTCLMMLAGFEAPTSGDILLGARSLRQVPPHKRDIGMVFQNYALFPHMTVAENVAFPLKVRGISREASEQRVECALAMVQLQGFAQRYPKQLSGGQQQRVALARALVFEPQLVLMDEPLGALDKQLREQMQVEIKDLHERLGLTVIYVTHDQSEALTMSDRVAVFHRGNIQQVDTPQTLYEDPRNAFVAQFIGENNRLSGRLLSRDGARCTVQLDSGERIDALAIYEAASGEPVSLFIRPERIRLGKFATASPHCGWGCVREFVYLGDHVRIRLDAFGSQHFIVKQAIAQRDTALSVGDRVPLTWCRDHVRALDPTGITE